MRTIKNTVGAVAEGENAFWNREHETATFIEKLDEGASLHLVAQRRIGKTSLMREVSRQIADRYYCVHVDAQKSASPEDFLAALSTETRTHQSLWEKTRQVFANVFGGAAKAIESLQVDEVTLTIREGLVGGNWQPKGDRLLAALAEADKPVVLFLDEVPILVNHILRGTDNTITDERIAATEMFLSWLRENTLRHQGRLRIVVTGSIGFEPILREARLSATINHLYPLPLGPWDIATAAGCLRALAAHYGLSYEEGTPEHMAQKLGACIPHHVQMYFAQVRDVARRNNRAICTLADADVAYKTGMLGTKGHVELSTFEERLKYVVPPSAEPFVLDLLTEAAVTGSLTADAIALFRREHGLEDRTNDPLVRRVLDVLEHDGYLVRRSEAFRFVSHLLRDWWKHRHGFGFTPASKRTS